MSSSEFCVDINPRLILNSQIYSVNGTQNSVRTRHTKFVPGRLSAT